MNAPKPKLAVWKFASCDGCQLSLLDLEDELLALAGAVELADFREATSRVVEGRTTCRSSRARSRPPTTPSGSRRCARASKALVTIGACATAGGVQALQQLRRRATSSSRGLRLARVHLDARDLDADRGARRRRLRAARLPDQQAPARRGGDGVPARPQAGDPVDERLHRVQGRGAVCVTVAHGTPCLGPVTHAGCGALCPAYERGCYGCFGPMETPNTEALIPCCGPGADGARRRARLPDVQRGRRGVPEGGRRVAERRTIIPTTSRASRARAR